MAKKNWEQNAVKNPGSFTKLAKEDKGTTKKGTIKQSFINKEMNSPDPITQKRADLANTFHKQLHHHMNGNINEMGGN